MDRHGETSIPPYNFVAGGIKILGIGFLLATHIWEQIYLRTPDRHFSKESIMAMGKNVYKSDHLIQSISFRTMVLFGFFWLLILETIVK
jgi:hypothetical protein